MKLEKAHIEVLTPVGPNLPKSFDVQFNPTEYTLNKGVQIAEIGVYGIDSPILQFIRGQNEKLNLDLFFDTTAEPETAPKGLGAGAKDVRDLTKPFYQLVKIQPDTHAPPQIQFTWGTGLSFKAIVESIQQKFTLFSPEGIPLRATLTVVFREYKTLREQIEKPNPQSADQTKTRLVKRADTLSHIAAEEYGDSHAWRAIADANPDLADPRRLAPGTVLVIPPLDVLSQPIVS